MVIEIALFIIAIWVIGFRVLATLKSHGPFKGPGARGGKRMAPMRER